MPARIYLTNFNELPGSVIQALLTARGIEVVGRGGAPVDPSAPGVPHANTPDGPDTPIGDDLGQVGSDIERYRPDVVIFGSRSESHAARLSQFLSMRVLLLTDHGGTVHCCQLRPDHQVVGDVSPDQLVELILATGGANDRAIRHHRA